MFPFNQVENTWKNICSLIKRKTTNDVCEEPGIGLASFSVGALRSVQYRLKRIVIYMLTLNKITDLFSSDDDDEEIYEIIVDIQLTLDLTA